jgi:hypothetical protein
MRLARNVNRRLGHLDLADRQALVCTQSFKDERDGPLATGTSTQIQAGKWPKNAGRSLKMFLPISSYRTNSDAWPVPPSAVGPAAQCSPQSHQAAVQATRAAHRTRTA